MSSMVRYPLAALLLAATSTLAVPAACAQPTADPAVNALTARQPTDAAAAVARWEQLNATRDASFADYAGFVLANPGFPREDTLRARAEAALDEEPVAPETLVAFFDRHPPLTNAARARYALALSALQRDEAAQVAREAWRGGAMSGPAEAYLTGLYGGRFGPEDHDARMAALLWQGDLEAARRQIGLVSPAYRPLAEARLAILEGSEPPQNDEWLRDAGYVYNLADHYMDTGQTGRAVALLANRPPFANRPFDAEEFVGLALRVAKGADGRSAQRIAARVDDLFAPNTDVSRLSYRLRDDYTSLMWLGGTEAMWNHGDPAGAAPLFYRYGAAAQTPQTRSKGFYWAALAARRAGDAAEERRYLEMAARYPERFYGQLALARLGQPVPELRRATATPDAAARRAFDRQPLARAVQHVARGAPWSTGIQFYRALAQNADTPEEHALAADLAIRTGRRDLAVNVAEAAGADGVDGFVPQGFPTHPVHAGGNWTIVHAIARQESQFAGNAISHAGARGLMQLMPATAREQAGKLGLGYERSALIDDAGYNIRLGDAYFSRMMDYYGGAYPLAVAAYNAGPGNVNKWLRSNGDPREGGIDWVTWIERIPIFETKNYVQRVIENAAVYEQLYPDRATLGRPRTAIDFLR